VGYAIMGGAYRASLWTGTAASWVDLTPAGSPQSLVNGVQGGQQVGTALVGGVAHAGLWSGTADSWVDLNPFVPEGFANSFGNGIWHDGAFTYVVGYGFNATTSRDEALLWVGTGACYPDCDASGTLDLFDFLCFVNLFNAEGEYADCDANGTFDLFDFLCFVNAFNAGC
jgi:hypothetical protein